MLVDRRPRSRPRKERTVIGDRPLPPPPQVARPREATLRITGLVKRFPGTVALRGVDFVVQPGEVHALLGANGAGKSTLIKVLAQLYAHDEGTITVSGEPLGKGTASRVSFIHQDLGLVDELTVAENIAVVGGFGRRGGLLSYSRTRSRARRALAIIAADIDPSVSVGELSRADKSLVAVARALSRPNDLIVLDEPTASLHEREVGRLFDVVRRLRAQGTAIVYVTHRLDEVFLLADTVSVLRDGQRVMTCPTAETTPEALVAAITGNRIMASRAGPSRPGAVALSVDGLRAASGTTASLELRSGEIVGAAGLQGAGHTEIGRAVCGLAPAVNAHIAMQGRPVTFRSPAEAIAHGVVFVTSDRETEGVAYDMTCQENLYLNPGARGASALRPRLRRRERADAEAAMERFGVSPADPTRTIATLSGGNQQKVILARCLSVDSSVLILEEPTMGVDVGGRADIFAILRQTAKEGKAILVISTNFEELAAVCDRIVVFDRGAVVDELRGHRISVATLTQVASGGAHV